MKKERKRRICNYFMKALLLCALVFGFGFIAGVDVNAKEHDIYVDESGSINHHHLLPCLNHQILRILLR